MKNISEMECNSFVCFTVDKENGREPAKQQRKGVNRTRRSAFVVPFLVAANFSIFERFKIKRPPK